jgi:hypothetical protein
VSLSLIYTKSVNGTTATLLRIDSVGQGVVKNCGPYPVSVYYRATGDTNLYNEGNSNNAVTLAVGDAVPFYMTDGAGGNPELYATSVYGTSTLKIWGA